MGIGMNNDNPSLPGGKGTGKIELDYSCLQARSELSRGRIFGIISFSAIALWVPWMGVFYMGDLFFLPHKAGVSPSKLELGILTAIAWLPPSISLITGLYSVCRAGVSLRNILGLLGFTSSAAVIGLSIIYWCS